ncbi:MAG: hypothetical protein WBD81_17860 [Collimonas pratensis]|uniref:hypothetical protein n=1 Tax=Collimonas pratensis TaxID=279113 RepID=UPI003C723714
MSEYSTEVHLISVPGGPLYAGFKILRPDGTHIVTSGSYADARIVIDRLNAKNDAGIGIGIHSVTGNSANRR